MASGARGAGGAEGGERARVRARARRVSEPARASEALEGVALFRELAREDRETLCELVVECEYARGDVVVEEGEEGGHFYVIAQGCVRVDARDDASRVCGDFAPVANETPRALERSSLDGLMDDDAATTRTKTTRKLLYPGETFGEVALVRKCLRTATVVAESPVVKLWALDRETFQATLKRTTLERRRKFKSYLDAVAVFRDSLDARTTSMLVDALRVATFGDGQIIMSPCDAYDDVSSKFYVIVDGEAAVYVEEDARTEVNRLKKGDYFGEVGLIHKMSPTATVVARGQVNALTLDAESFHRMIGDETVKLMADRIETYTYAPNKVETRSTARLTRCTRSFAALRGVMTSPLRWLSFDRRNPSRGNLDDDSSQRVRPVNAFSTAPELEARSIKDVLFLKEIGGGMLGAVFLARTLKSHEICCVKVMHKWKVAHLEQEFNVTRELELMRRFDSPFLTRAMGAFQDARALYLLMDYLPGGDLFQLLVSGPFRGGRFPVNVAQFYAAEVFIALEYIHAHEYIYRDLKPENVLIGADGHVKLTDFGFCRRLLPGERAYTTCGTADYMAPEVMLAQGYDHLADYWSFGVLLYEMLVGYAPFASVSDGVRHRRIVTSDLRFHSSYFPLTAKSLISRLCVVDVSRRLGSSARGAGDLKSHDFFRPLDWTAVTARRVEPPSIPSPSAPAPSADTSVARHRSRELSRALERRSERERVERGAAELGRDVPFAGF